MSLSASQNIHRSAEQTKSTDTLIGPAQGSKIPTTSESTGTAIARSGANAGLVSSRSTSSRTVFRSGDPKRGGFGKIRTTSSSPCPVCDRAGCSYSDDESLLICWRSAGESLSGEWVFIKPGSNGGSLFARAGSSERSVSAVIESIERERLTGSASWAARVERYLADPEVESQRRRLAAELGVDVWSLAALSVGWKGRAYGVGAWSYPQRTAAGEIVSVGLRLDQKDDSQRYDHDGRSKSPPGLIFIPGRWLTSTGPVLIVEGMSDTAALDTIRIDAVGHPGTAPKKALLDELETLLRKVPEDRPIIRVAERDKGREHDENSPGRIGARATAQALANRLARPVGVALAPDDVKDSRAWIRERWSPTSGNRDALRKEFVAGILAGVAWFQPEDRVADDVVVEPLADRGVEIELDEYRRRMREDLEAWASDTSSTGRIAVLAAPAGAGKTTGVDELVLPKYDRWANAVPTHENCRERRATLSSLPIIEVEVAAYPKLDAETCQSFTDEQAADLRDQGHRQAVSADRATRFGFGVRSTACLRCPLAPWKPTGVETGPDLDLDAFSPDRVFGDVVPELAVEVETDEPPDEFSSMRCRYWREVGRANAARGKVATLERVRRTDGRILEENETDRGLLVLDERGFETVAPTVAVDVHKLELLATGLEGAALRIESEQTSGATVSSGDVCKNGKPHKFSTTRIGKSFVDVCGVCGHRVELTVAKRKRGRLSTTVDSLFDTTEERDRRRRDRKRSHERSKKESETERRKAERQADKIEHLRQLAAVAAGLADRLRAMSEGSRWGVETVDVVRERKRRKVAAAVDQAQDAPGTLIVRGRVVKQSARLLADALERSLPSDAIVHSDALELVRRVHARRVDMVALHADPIDPDESRRAVAGERRVRLSALATWATRLPQESDILILDGTLDVKALSQRIGRPVSLIGPEERIRRSTFAAQLPADISRGTAVSTVAKTLERALAALSDAKRVGIILLNEHRQALFPVDREGNDIRTKRSRELVPDDVLRRIARDADGRLLIEHFGGGKDRSSNQWIEHCDGLVLLGTPRPQSTAVVGELVRRLDRDALVRGSTWGRRDWEGRTIDGRRVRCRGRGYLDPAWAHAAAAVTRTALRQALERARTVVPTSEGAGDRPGGIPVLVVTSEGGLDLPVVEALPTGVSRGARRVEEVVRELVGAADQGQMRSEDHNPGKIGNPESVPEGSPISLTDSTRDHIYLVGRMRLIDGPVVGSRSVIEKMLETEVDGRRPSRATVFRWISEAESAGLIIRSGSTRSTVYGLPAPVEIPDAVEDFPIVGADDLVPDVPQWDIDDIEILGPTWVDPPTDLELVPTGPSDPWRMFDGSPYFATGPTAA